MKGQGLAKNLYSLKETNLAKHSGISDLHTAIVSRGGEHPEAKTTGNTGARSTYTYILVGEVISWGKPKQCGGHLLSLGYHWVWKNRGSPWFRFGEEEVRLA